MATALTPTSYAILGLLALKPWSTYELAQQMERALGQFWPRAESRLYEEPKKLVAHGLARPSSEMVGQRPRTIYTITAKGRRALESWVPLPGEGAVLECEELIKVFFAEHATKADLLATVARIRERSERQLGTQARFPRAYLDGQGPFPERLAWVILVTKFLVEFHLMVERWADWATDVVERWPDDLAAAPPDWETLEEHAAITRARAPGDT
ncbi:MAG TPA: helix-turn-helix transcriptional regulator [Acidimicrobiales bacterium]|nr:helix-turn-helix transcriptional regulator [Acidimicrobiales bacterium]